MRKLVVNIFVTHDCVMQAPGGPPEDWKGKRLFGEGKLPSNLKLTDSKISRAWVIIATYEPAGELSVGTFELNNPSEAELARRKRLLEEG